MNSRGIFVTATGTDAGKTFLARGLARALTRRFSNVAALKPIETGCAPDPRDAPALASACRRPELADDPDFYRIAPPLAPYAATLSHRAPSPDLERIARRIQVVAAQHDFTLVEGAGGLLVPTDAARTLADLAELLSFPLLLVAPDRLGVLSYVLTAYESATARRLEVAAVILTRGNSDDADPSLATNAQILTAKLQLPVHIFPHTPDDDEALANAVESSAILASVIGT